MFDRLFKLIEQGVKGLHSFILHHADKRWFIVLVLVLALVGICVMLAKFFYFDIFGGVLKFAAAVAVAVFLIKKIEKTK